MLTFRYEYGSIYEIQKAPVTKNINLTNFMKRFLFRIILMCLRIILAV